MFTTENVKQAANQSGKSKAKEKEKKPKAAGKQQTERLKTVVRKLPANLPEDVFWQSVQPWVTEETVSWRAYYKGKPRKRLNKENIPSRAYIAFKNEEILAVFSREYDGHIFRDKAGNESIAIVEFAPFQKTPSEKKKLDSRMGTIEKDEDYISFLESLKEGASRPTDMDNLELLVAASQPPPQPTTTPLLEALKAEKSAQKDKEAILRNHAHYKDPAALAGPSITAKKEDTKKKAATSVPNTQKAGEPHASKKAAKKAVKAAQQQQSSTAAVPATKMIQPQAIQQKHNQPISAAGNPPKAPREPPPRERHPKPSAASAGPAALLPAPAASAEGVSSSETASTSAPAQPASSRRTRPILGLASRHFEAALTEAGVERRARREKDRQAQNATGSQTPATIVEDTNREKQAEDRRGGGDASVPAPAASRAPSAATGQGQRVPTAPVILQREYHGPKVPPPARDGDTEEGASSGRGGRQRPRGRGRGGARGGS